MSSFPRSRQLARFGPGVCCSRAVGGVQGHGSQQSRRCCCFDCAEGRRRRGERCGRARCVKQISNFFRRGPDCRSEITLPQSREGDAVHPSGGGYGISGAKVSKLHQFLSSQSPSSEVYVPLASSIRRMPPSRL